MPSTTALGAPSLFRRHHSPVTILRGLLALTVAFTGITLIATTPVDAAACVRFSGGHFDAPGNDNYAAYLNGEYVKIKNYCTTTKSMGSWKLHDYGTKHTYTFSSTFKLAAGATVTVYSGKGTNSATKRFWGQSYGAIWNNTPPEKAYLLNSSGTLQ